MAAHRHHTRGRAHGDRELVDSLLESEMGNIEETVGEQGFSDGGWDAARDLFTEMAISDDYADFLTLPAYERMP